MSLRRLTLATAFLAAAPVAAQAQMATGPYVADPAPLAPASFDYGESDLVFELGAGGRVSPEYPGSDAYKLSPFPIIAFEYLNLPGVGSFGGPEGLGLSFGPSFGYNSEREANDVPGLRGLDDVDAVYEAGLKASYRWQNAEIYGAARYAFGGVDAVVGEFGGNLVARPTPVLELRAGPFARLASEDYLQAYFGVSDAAAMRTGLTSYSPEGGFLGVGVQGEVKYEMFTDTFINVEASYERLVGDAASSPLAVEDNQYTVGLGISRRFSFDLF